MALFNKKNTLQSLSKTCGWAAKIDPVGLGKLLDSLPKNEDPNLLVGFDTSDDAGVYKLTEEIAIVTTADYITPPVNDPFIYGQIAAANSISDVYAMGGRPITCLNLVNFPDGQLPPEELHKIILPNELSGMNSKLKALESEVNYKLYLDRQEGLKDIFS